MFRYYLLLGLRSLRRNPALTALMVITLAIGVAASISTLTILHVMSGDPIPSKSSRLFVPFIDVALARDYVPGKKDLYSVQSTYKDIVNYLRSAPALRRTAIYDVQALVQPPRREDPAIDLSGVGTTADYFPMFEIPFKYGAGWTAAEDAGSARVAVLSRAKSEAIFGNGVDPVGKSIRIWNNEFRVVGVVNDWHPMPRFTNLINGTGGYYRGEEELFVPFNTAISLEAQPSGNTTCSKDSGTGWKGFLESECVWIQPWFELKSVSERPALQTWLDSYAADERRGGRLERKAPNRLFDTMEWLDYLEVVRADNKLAVWLSFGFLLLCIVNTMGLLLAKFSARAGEVGVRRALGAGQGAIFHQFLVETGVIGFAGGLLGVVLAFASLWLIRLQSRDLSVVAYMDLTMLAATFAIAVVASLVAGLLPTWRACQVSPALQLKSQ
jgi:putative ABC transport system permease protein